MKYNEDLNLLKVYNEGFIDELDGCFSDEKYKEDKQLLKAYNTGGIHAIAGDDMPSLDYINIEEKLKMIKS